MSAETVREQTRCCVVGGGPGGMVLAYLLAGTGVDVTLLEMHGDFDREFRGDTFHSPSTRLMADVGLLDRLDAITHAKVRKLSMYTEAGNFVMLDATRLAIPFPWIGLVPQHEFLGMLAEEGQRRFPNLRIVLEATARELIEEDGTVRGVVYRQHGQTRELRADLVVGADGRTSRIRRLAGLELVTSSPPMDVLWFRLPHEPGDDEAVGGIAFFIHRGKFLIWIPRGDYWQVGYVILKGSLDEIKASGIETLHRDVERLVPRFGARIRTVADWKDVAVLAVQSGRVERWHRPGLLLIGDAAHVMSPVGGVGINYAIMDAIAAANVLAEPLRAGRVEGADLALVQKRRESSTRFIQGIQEGIQRRIVGAALRSDAPFQPPLPMRLLPHVPILRDLPALALTRGLRAERLRPALRRTIRARG